VDQVVAEARLSHSGWSPVQWIESGRLIKVGGLVVLELGLAVMADFSSRCSSLVDSLLAETYSNFASIRLMERAASLDLEQFESSDQQDRLDRARRQVTGRTALLGLVFGEIQDILTAVSFVIGLVAYWPWLITLMMAAVVPSLVGELKFNAQSYRLDYFRTPERRQLDYVRYLGSSIDTVKEVKLFGLSRFLIDKFRRFAETMFRDNRRLATRSAFWGGLFAALGTVAYYLAYAAIIWRAMAGEFSLGDMAFLVGSFLRLKSLLDGLLLSFAQVAGQALYLDDLFSFLDIQPRIVSPANPLPMSNPIRSGFVFENVAFATRAPSAGRSAISTLKYELARSWRWSGRTVLVRPR
jgi:ATP-binding cassette, subfamily B, bacterial